MVMYAFFEYLDDDQEFVIILNNSGEKFLCFLPKVEKSKGGKLLSQHNISSMIVELETRSKLKAPDELLEVLKDWLSGKRDGGYISSVIRKAYVKIHVGDKKVIQ